MSTANPYRYPGARPFDKSQEHLFFGRQQAVQELYRMVHLSPLVVLYSKSGLGKSSLLNAGLLPAAQAEGLLEPVVVRFGAWTREREESPQAMTRARILEGFDEPTFLKKVYPDDRSLWYAVKTRQLNSEDPKSLLLVFDQFEELFTYPREKIAQFGRQLSELLYSGIPQRVRKMVELFEMAQPEHLSDAEQEAVYRKAPVKAIVAIRSDRMSLLDQLSPHVPQILDNRYELSALTPEQAQDAILEPSQLPGAFASPAFDYEPESLKAILQYLTSDNSEPIESFQLQILCQSIERMVIARELPLIKAEDLGHLPSIFKNYYENQIALLGDESEQLAARRLIEEGLVFEEEERRISLYEGQIFRQYGISEALLARLIDTHLIRREPSMRGGYTYELSHDTLVEPVLNAKMKRQAEERQRAEAEALAERERELAVERRKRRQARLLAAVMTVLAIISAATGITAFLGFRQASQAKVSLQRTITDLEQAQAARMEAEEARRRLRAEQLLNDAETYIQAYEYQLAMDKLQTADSLNAANPAIQQKMTEVQEKLRDQEKRE